jgi:hypothetical protein
MFTYLFRKPKFPIICDIDGIVIAARSEKSFAKQLEKVPLNPEKSYRLVDVSGEGWSFLVKHMAISPLAFKKKWFKKEIISLYNNRKNSSSDSNKYSEKLYLLSVLIRYLWI